jgi:hypothetical protein
MKTVVISGSQPIPPRLRELIERGSTSVHEHRAHELEDAPIADADRIVFWSTESDASMRAFAEKCAKAEAADRRERLVYVTIEHSQTTQPALSPTELFVWPRDEDRLKMAFLTGA